MSRNEALDALFRAKAESGTEDESLKDLYVFAVGFFLGGGMPKLEAKRLAIDAVSNGFWPQFDSLEVAASV